MSNEVLYAIIIAVPTAFFVWIVWTVMALHNKGVYFWSLASTWVSLCATLVAGIIAAILGSLHDKGGPYIFLIASGLLWVTAMTWSFFYNFRAAGSIILALSTTLLQQFVVFICFLLWLRFFQPQARIERGDY